MKELAVKAYITNSKPSFFRGGPLCFNVDDKFQSLAFNHMIDYAKGAEVRLTIEPWSETKTQALNRFFHLLLKKLYASGMHNADSKLELKIYIKNTFGVAPKEVNVNGELFLYIKSPCQVV